jgi:outer membrane protein insertion porin family
VKIKKIEIIGNHKFSDKTLKKKMKNRQKYWWPWSGKFNKEEFEEDPMRIAKFYWDNGYPNCKVVRVDVIPDERREWVTIEIEIDEGKRLYFGEVKFEGNKVISTKKLLRGVKFKRNEPYSKSKIAKTMEWIYVTYSDEGYLYLKVDPVESIRDSIVDIVYKLQEGRPARIHKIIIQDNVKTHEKVIRRELTIFPGEIFSRKKLIVSQRKVFNLGFFKNILLDTRQANEKGDIDLIIKVEEKETGQASLGASYYPKYGIAGNLSLSIPNFRGRGEHLYISLEKGAKVERMAFGYTKPWLFDTPLTVGTNLYRTLESRYWYRMKKTGGEIRVSRAILRLNYVRVRASYRLESVGISEISDTTVLSRIPQGLRSVVIFGINRDSRDNFLNPTVGTRNDLQLEFCGGIFGGNIHYHKQIFETSTYHKLGWKFVLGLRGRMGIINGYKSDAEVPLYEKFILGGIGAWGLRGYKDWSIGPSITKQGEVIGGRFAFIFTIEAKIAFTPHNIYPLVFFDAGNAWECLSEANFQDLKRGIGVGFRIEIPMMGLVGFDFGYRLDTTPIQRRRGHEFHLQMGRMF